MILVDTSVWVDHFSCGDAQLQALLEEGDVLAHPMIITTRDKRLHRAAEQAGVAAHFPD